MRLLLCSNSTVVSRDVERVTALHTAHIPITTQTTEPPQHYIYISDNRMYVCIYIYIIVNEIDC